MSSKRVALVTGAGRGIGFGIAKSLAKAGFDIAICDVHESDAVKDAMDELASDGAETLYCRADVTDADARSQMLKDIKSKFGALHVLINNAGVAPKVRLDVMDTTEESFERLMSINLQGPFFLTQGVANWMVELKQADADYAGCIVNISSISATTASPSRGEYCISKAGVSMATQLWATRLGEYDIPVYEIRPGIIKTEMTAPVTEKYDKLIAEGLLVQSRWGFPEDIGRAVAMLARGDLAYSTGQVIMIDGGFAIPRL